MVLKARAYQLLIGILIHLLLVFKYMQFCDIHVSAKSMYNFPKDQSVNHRVCGDACDHVCSKSGESG